MAPSTKKHIASFGTLFAAFLLLTLFTKPWQTVMSWLFPSLDEVLYDMAPLSQLASEHGVLVLISSGLATVLGLAAGIAVTRSWGRDLLPAVNALASMGQTFPPVAVLAIAVPVAGFGFKPTIIALFLYGLLPVIRNTITGIDALPPDILEAAAGMGMTPLQVLYTVELPLAMPVFLAGIRISTVINVGTATPGATIGAGGLGKPIIAGLIGENPAFILEGGHPRGSFRHNSGHDAGDDKGKKRIGNYGLRIERKTGLMFEVWCLKLKTLPLYPSGRRMKYETLNPSQANPWNLELERTRAKRTLALLPTHLV